jgi:hypothetical protein
MIEMRWYVPVTGEKVLQYRQKVDATVYAGIGPFPDSAKNMQWSKWTDVPLESERNPDYP